MPAVRASAAKPADLGTGVVAASIAEDGSWLSVGGLHPRVGFVELNGLPPFDEAWRGDPDATRRYRNLLIDRRYAFLGISPTPEPAITRATVVADQGSRTIVQSWRLGDGVERILRATPRLDRPALAEITEVSPPEPTGAVTRLEADGLRLVAAAAALPAVATIDVDVVPGGASWHVDGDAGELQLGANAESITITVTLTSDSAVPPPRPAPVAQGGAPPARHVPASLPGGPPGPWIERAAARAIAYIRSCTALEYRPGERAILTDHRVLPLSWTRDAYYQALLLIAGGSTTDMGIVGDHLRWLWRGNERVDGRWMRSHHGNGRPKDLVYQADQQLYPLLELADFWRATGTLPHGVDWAQAVASTWAAVEAAIDPRVGLIGTEEDSADDRVEMPYIAANQVLLWYTTRRLAEEGLAERVGLVVTELDATSARIHAAFEHQLVLEGRWAYAIDGRGGHADYHDANDLPLALAPAWGFCSADDPAWRATVAFAFSSANPGFVDGPGGGLGSLHTPGAWPLGLIQAWLIGRTSGNDLAARWALATLEDAAFADAMLPEAYIREGSDNRRIRHWFAWPGAVLGALWLLDSAKRVSALAATRPGGSTFAPVAKGVGSTEKIIYARGRRRRLAVDPGRRHRGRFERRS